MELVTVVWEEDRGKEGFEIGEETSLLRDFNIYISPWMT